MRRKLQPVAFGTVILLMTGMASAAELRVMISAGFYQVYSELGPSFERTSGHRLVTTRGPSMGDSPEAIPVDSREAKLRT
jgi:molybdate transport system substrate-binding protein